MGLTLLWKRIGKGLAVEFGFSTALIFLYVTAAWTHSGSKYEIPYGCFFTGPNGFEDSGHTSLLDPLFQLMLIAMGVGATFLFFKARGIEAAGRSSVLSAGGFAALAVILLIGAKACLQAPL